MSMDLQNQSAGTMSMGQLSSSFTQLNGAISDMTKQVNAGQVPTVSGGEYGGMGLAEEAAAPVSKSSFAQGGSFPNTGHTVTPMTQAADSKAPLDPLFGMRYTRKQYLEMTRREAETLSFIAKKGYMPAQRKSEETFRASDSLFAKAATSGGHITALDFARTMKFAKMTPEMMINLGIIPKSIKDNLDMTFRTMDKPEATQVVNTARAGENENGQRMFDNSSADGKERIAEALGTKQKKGQSNAYKPPSIKIAEEKRGEYLN